MFVEALREDYDWLADSLEEESATSHYEIDTRNLTKSAEKCAYESKFDSFKEQNIKVGHVYVHIQVMFQDIIVHWLNPFLF